MKKTIFVALSTFAEFDPEPRLLLERSGHTFTCNTLGKRLAQDEIIRLAKGADGIIAGVEPYDARVLTNLPGLRCISRCGVGIDAIDLTKAKELGITVRNTPDVVIQPVAELAVAMVFDLMRRLSQQTAWLKAGKWNKAAGNLVAGKKAGIIGLGRIGKRTAGLLSALGCEIYAYDIAPDDQWAQKTGVRVVALKTLLAECDIVSLHTAMKTGDRPVLGPDELGLMKKGAVIVNTSRGSAIDEDALHAALAGGRLAGAGLDVYPKEPYSGKLRALENVVLTPHVATLTVESRAQMEKEAVANLLNSLKDV